MGRKSIMEEKFRLGFFIFSLPRKAKNRMNSRLKGLPRVTCGSPQRRLNVCMFGIEFARPPY